MAPRTDSTGRIVQERDRNQTQSLASLVQRLTPELARALPRHLTPDRMARIALTALRVTPKLAECTAASFAGSLLSAAQLGLEVNTPMGHAWLIPRLIKPKNSPVGVMTCQLQIGYQGAMELARRAGAKSIRAHEVRDGDEFSFELGLEPKLRHVPSGDAEREDRAVTASYAVATAPDGTREFSVLTRPQIDARRRRSQAAQSGPWVTDFAEMAKKSAVLALCKYLPRSAELAQAHALEHAADTGAQGAAYSPEVSAALLTEGLAADTVVEAVPEPASEPAVREPGADG